MNAFKRILTLAATLIIPALVGSFLTLEWVLPRVVELVIPMSLELIPIAVVLTCSAAAWVVGAVTGTLLYNQLDDKCQDYS